MKFQEEVCGNCGLDLTKVEPGNIEQVPVGDKDEMVPYAECPGCHTNRIVVAPELAISPDPEPEAPEPEEAPAEEPGPEE